MSEADELNTVHYEVLGLNRQGDDQTGSIGGSMIEAIKIEKGVPIPDKRQKSMRGAMAEMEVGDSFLIPNSKSRSVGSTGSQIPGSKKFVTRKINDTESRVWRVS